MSKFTAALAAAKPSDAVKLPADTYTVRVVSATPKPSANGMLIRFDLETINGRATGDKFVGRRQIKNQPLTEAAAGYVAALCHATDNLELLTNAALAESLEAGEEPVLRRFVGKTFIVTRSYAANGDTNMEIAVQE
jgi:hypothetical protein